jgi:hypothetical protein
MLELKLHQSGAKASPSPDVSLPDTEVWRDEEGVAVAYGGSEAERHWMLLPGVGVYVFGSDAAVEAFPDEAVRPEVVEDGFRRIVLPMALQVLGREVLHASAVLHPAGVVALCAVSGTGKSTLAQALSGRGHPLWADDAVVFELGSEAVRALPLPFTLRLAGERSGPIYEPEPANLAAIALLERAGTGISVERMTPAAAFPAVLTHAYCFTLRDRKRNAAMVESYLELVQRVPVLTVRFPDEVKRVSEIAAAIEQAAGDG